MGKVKSLLENFRVFWRLWNGKVSDWLLSHLHLVVQHPLTHLLLRTSQPPFSATSSYSLPSNSSRATCLTEWSKANYWSFSSYSFSDSILFWGGCGRDKGSSHPAWHRNDRPWVDMTLICLIWGGGAQVDGEGWGVVGRGYFLLYFRAVLDTRPHPSFLQNHWEDCG